jgi:hypothetical protein
MLTMVTLAIFAAFAFGFILSGMFVLGAGADRENRPRFDEMSRLQDVASPRSGHDHGSARRLESQGQGLTPLGRDQRRPQSRRRANSVRRSAQ